MLYFCLIAPSFVGLKLLDSLIKKQKLKDLILNYMVINFFTNVGATFIYSSAFYDELGMGESLKVFGASIFKYSFIAVLISLVFSFCYSLILKNISISLEYNGKRKTK